MPVKNDSYSDRNSIASDLKTVSDLQKNERIRVKSTKLSRYTIPDPTTSAIIKVIQYVMKIFMTPKTEFEIKAVATLLDRVSKSLDSKSEKIDPHEEMSYLQEISQRLDKLDGVLETYKEIIKSSPEHLSALNDLKDNLDNLKTVCTTKISDLEKIIKASSPRSLVEARGLLTAKYGEHAAERALKRYGFDNKTSLSHIEFQTMRLSAANHLTTEEAAQAYEARNPGEDFKKLSEQEVGDFLIKIRNVKPPTVSLKKNDPNYKNFEHDKCLNIFFAQSKSYDPKNSDVAMKEYGFAEYVGHYMITALFTPPDRDFEGILVPFYDKSGECVVRETHKIVADKGLLGAAFVPIKIRDNDAKGNIQIAFRGTKDVDSAKRDLNLSLEGPGRNSFVKHQKEIVDKINEQVNQLYEINGGAKVALEFMGHSLGGSDSQRACAAYLDKTENQNKVKELNMYVFNSPGIEIDIAEKFIQNVQKKPGIKTDLHYFNVTGDIVQEFGRVKLGHNPTKVNLRNMNVHVYEFAHPAREKGLKEAVKHASLLHRGQILFKEANVPKIVKISSTSLQLLKKSSSKLNSLKNSTHTVSNTVHDLLVTKTTHLGSNISKATKKSFSYLQGLSFL